MLISARPLSFGGNHICCPMAGIQIRVYLQKRQLYNAINVSLKEACIIPKSKQASWQRITRVVFRGHLVTST